ncbi:MATE family efflux transporter [Enterococcus gallinarum]|uniref:MATE family efflux transporter n=1 Tax=Enterococcus gallinarum TaxID=1353 RepID=UPI002DBF911A|nr:MATE family efflux transporter [Enterococcus gallinarum]
MAVSVGTSVGMISLISRSLGAKKFEEANKAAGNGVTLAIIIYIVFALFGLFGASWYMTNYTDNVEVIEMGTIYLQTLLIFSFNVTLQIMFERIIQSTGITIYTMIVQLIGAAINIILDPIFIFGWLGIPAMGVRGAAIATVIAQFISMSLIVIFNKKVNQYITITKATLKLKLTTVKEIYRVDFPAILMQSILPIMNMGLNTILVSNQSAVAVLGAYFKLSNFAYMPVFGLINGTIPLFAYNFGAEKKARVKETLKKALVIALVILTIGFLLFLIIPSQLLTMFNVSEATLEVGRPALRIIGFAFPLASIGILFSALFQSLGKGVYSLVISLFRQLVTVLPLAYVLYNFIGLEAVWLALPLGELVGAIISLAFYKRVYQRYLS